MHIYKNKMRLKGHLFLTLPISVPGWVTPKSLKLIKCKIKDVSLEPVGEPICIA